MIGKSTFTIVLLATIAVAVAFAFGPAATPAVDAQDGAKYIGTKKCGMCHADQTETYNEMKHAKAFDVLSDEQVASGKNEQGLSCVQCHTTGYGKDGGFSSVEDTPDMKNVGCESCHGPGSMHQKTMMMAAMNDENPEEKHISRSVDCSGCHNPHISYKKLYGK